LACMEVSRNKRGNERSEKICCEKDYSSGSGYHPKEWS
jgi:hypothetical protein